jgi:hypothetical protein
MVMVAPIVPVQSVPGLEAIIVIGKLPAWVGVPDRTPAEDKVSPGGSVPVSVNTLPADEVNAAEYGISWVPIGMGLGGVIARSLQTTLIVYCAVLGHPLGDVVMEYW